MDISKAGLYITVLAVVLAVPLSVVANLVTPKIRDWYSSTSEKRLRRRITELELKLRSYEIEWVFSPADWDLFSLIYRSAWSIVLCFAFFGLLIFTRFSFTILPRYATLLSRASAQIALVLQYAILFLPVGVILTLTAIYDRARQVHTVEGRNELLEQINKLKSVSAREEPPSDL